MAAPPEVNEDPAGPTGDAGPGEEQPRPLRAPRRFSALLLVGGAVVAVLYLMPHWPREREIQFRLDDPRSVTGLDVSWSDQSDGDAGSAVHGGSWQFAPGAAPPTVNQTVRLPDGEYGLEITISRTTGIDGDARTITLGEMDRITVPVR